jgi:hypothetical protein
MIPYFRMVAVEQVSEVKISIDGDRFVDEVK